MQQICVVSNTIIRIQPLFLNHFSEIAGGRGGVVLDYLEENYSYMKVKPFLISLESIRASA